jgi:hypothetical protein
MDTGSLVWSDDALTEGLRLALGEYNLAQQLQDPYQDLGSINGLDGASITLLPELHESLVTLGAAAYCALSRALDRSVSYDLNSESAVLVAWGNSRLKEFKVSLGILFPKYLGAAVDSGGGNDSTLTAAQVALLTAQAALANAQATQTQAQASLASAQATQAQAQAALIHAQADLTDAQTAAATGQETRAAAAAQQAAADRTAEAARLAGLHNTSKAPWGTWKTD